MPVSSRLVSSRLVSLLVLARGKYRWGIAAIASLAASCGSVDDRSDDEIRTLGQTLVCEVPAAFESEALDVSAPAECSEGVDRYYAHPFQNVEILDGFIPLLDIKNSVEGKRYAIGHEVSQREEGSPIERNSGLLELERQPIVGASELPFSSPVGARPAEKIEPSLQEAIAALEAAGTPSSELEIIVHAARPAADTLQQRLDRAVAEGRIATYSDYHTEVQRLMDQKRAEIRMHMKPLLDSVATLGARSLVPCRNGYCARTTLRADKCLEVAARADVQLVSLNLSGGGPAVTFAGNMLREVSQADQFFDYEPDSSDLDRHYDGDNGSATDITGAIIEYGNGFRNTHNVFKEASGTGTRIRGMYNCGNGSSCLSLSSGWTSNFDHGTGVASAVFGDLRDGQESGMSGGTATNRSAAGGESKMYLYGNIGSSTDFEVALDSIIDKSPMPKIVNMSFHLGAAPDCYANNAASIDLDDFLFENGILSFNAAGNDGGSPVLCKIGRPGGAPGAFVVGGWGSNSSTDYDDNCDAREQGMASNSSWGSSSGRSIVDVTGPYCTSLRADDASDASYSKFCGTSNATPSVMSGAIAFVDMYKNEHDNFIDDPAALHAWMLLMSDGASSATTWLSNGYHAHFGAGRQRLLMLNDTGTDGPYLWTDFWTCVDHGEQYEYMLNGGQPLTGIEEMRVAAFWYDRNVEVSQLDDVNLAVVRADTGATVLADDDSEDDKAMVRFDPLANVGLKIRLSGANVDSDNAGCGTNSMKVYVVIYGQDSNRDDALGPSYNFTTCEGVEPF